MKILLETARFLIGTIVALLVKLLRYTRHQRDGPIEQTIDLRQANLARILDQTIASLGTLLAAHVSRVLQIEQESAQETFSECVPIWQYRPSTPGRPRTPCLVGSAP